MALRQQAAKTAPSTKKGPRCTVCVALGALPKADAQVLRDWMADPSWTFPAIADEVADDPDTPTLSVSAISRHARGQCGARERLRGPQ
ncbi:hypothetical protein GCM10028801_31050 [Nocardioides maradonensis]